MARPFRRSMMTSSNGNIFRVTGPLCGEFTGPGEFPAQRPVTRSFDVFFDLRPNKRLSKQPWGWWFETPLWSLWRQCNSMGVQILDSYSASVAAIMGAISCYTVSPYNGSRLYFHLQSYWEISIYFIKAFVYKLLFFHVFVNVSV